MSEFEDRMRHLADEVGPGRLTVECVVDQVYAKYQELRDDLKLHGGGQHHYLRDGLFGGQGHIMRALAESLITAEGSQIKQGAIDGAEHLSGEVFKRAPFEFGDLKASGHPRVLDNGAEVYDRPPAVHRLTTAELRAKGDLRRLGFGNAGSITPDIAAALGIG